MLMGILLLYFFMKSIVLFMHYMSSISQLEFKWSVHVIDALNQLHVIYT